MSGRGNLVARARAGRLMAELLVAFDAPVSDAAGTFQARAVGRPAGDGMWEGWIEFLPVDGGDPLVSPVESRQPEREHLFYWATGLTAVYLEGALHRARLPAAAGEAPVTPVSSAPAAKARRAAAPPMTPETVLDPFDVGGRSLDILRQDLGALNRPRLLNIIAAYDLNPGGEDIDWLSDSQLAHFIVTVVETRLRPRARG